MGCVAALPEFEEAMRCDPADSRSFQWAGQCLAELKRYQDTIHCYQQAIVLNPHYYKMGLQVALADVFYANRQLPEAIETLKVAATLQEDDIHEVGLLTEVIRRIALYEETLLADSTGWANTA